MNLTKLKDELETGCLYVRTTKTKAVIASHARNEDKGTLQFLKKKSGVQVKWWGYVESGDYEYIRCDMGHSHRAFKEKKFVFEYSELNRNDLKRLIEFLKEQL